MKEEMLFGHPKYEVESLADTLQRAQDAEELKPELHAAAVKLLKQRHKGIGIIIAKSLRRKRNG